MKIECGIFQISGQFTITSVIKFLQGKDTNSDYLRMIIGQICFLLLKSHILDSDVVRVVLSVLVRGVNLEISIESRML